ncbi:MAG: heme oxygenase (biliverdin-producing) [Nocardioidaceae bacterium]
MTTVIGPTAQPLSRLMREGSRAEHEAAETSAFAEALLRGEVNADGYGAYLLRLSRIYDALERTGHRLADDPVAGVVVDRALERRDALAADLDHWIGPHWASLPVDSPATETYVQRIRASSSRWSGLFVAHHYTRYLGDLSGGQAIGRVVTRTYAPPEGVGTAFYAFEGITKPKPYKDAYRARLDALPLEESDKRRIEDEVRIAFALNSAVFAELAERMDEYAA